MRVDWGMRALFRVSDEMQECWASLAISQTEKQERLCPKPDPWKYERRHKVWPKPMHRNWCGQGEKRWNGYEWEEV